MKLSNIIKNTNSQTNVKNHVFQAFKQPEVSDKLYELYEHRSALLNQAIRANRDYAYILKLSQDLDEVVNPIMRGQVR